MSIFVPAALAQPITLCLFDGKPTMSGFIHQLISTNVHFSDESHQDLDLLVTKLHPSAPIVLGLPWLQSTNPIIDWLTLTLTFQTKPHSSLLALTNAQLCTTTAVKHKDIIPNISPLIASIPELYTPAVPNLSEPPFDYTLSGSSMVKLGPASSKLLVRSTTVINPQPVGPVDSVNTADSNLAYVVDSTEVANTQSSHHIDSVYTANCDHPHTINSSFLADGGKEFSLREVPHLWATNPYDPLPFPEEFDAVLFTWWNPPLISLIGAAVFKKLIDVGEDVFTLHFWLFTGPIANLQAVGNDPAPTMALHAELLPMDENKLITKVVPPEYHNFFNVFSHKEVKLMPPHHPYDHTIDLENDQMPPHSHIYPLSGTELSTLLSRMDFKAFQSRNQSDSKWFWMWNEDLTRIEIELKNGDDSIWLQIQSGSWNLLLSKGDNKL